MNEAEASKLAELESRIQDQDIAIQAIQTQLMKLLDLAGQGSAVHGVLIAAVAKIAEHVGLENALDGQNGEGGK